MACSVGIQPTALRELDSTVEYLPGFGPNTASSFLNEWEAAIKELHDVIEHSLSRFDTLARLGYRTALMKNYVILYFEEGDTVVVAHLLHQSQDYTNIALNGLR